MPRITNTARVMEPGWLSLRLSERGLSMRQAAEMSGVSATTWYRANRGLPHGIHHWVKMMDFLTTQPVRYSLADIERIA